MRSKKRLPFLLLDLPDEEAARGVAKELARRTRKQVIVKDQYGEEIATEAPPRRNEIIPCKQH